jgi:hypothetical protein
VSDNLVLASPGNVEKIIEILIDPELVVLRAQLAQVTEQLACERDVCTTLHSKYDETVRALSEGGRMTEPLTREQVEQRWMQGPLCQWLADVSVDFGHRQYTQELLDSHRALRAQLALAQARIQDVEVRRGDKRE